MAEFFTRVREAMQVRGVSQAELARRLGVSPAAVSEWLTRGRVPSADTVLFMPSALGVSGHWLLTGFGTRDLPHSVEEDPYAQGANAVIREFEGMLEELRGRYPKPSSEEYLPSA